MKPADEAAVKTKKIRKRIDPSLEEELMSAALDEFGPGNPYGVYAIGIGSKRRNGESLHYRTLTAFVERKLAAPENPVPAIHFESGGNEWTCVPDIIATGQRACVENGRAVHFNGLFPGASIALRDVFHRVGGVGALVSVAPNKGPTHLITAGHLFFPRSPGTPIYCALGAGQAVREVGGLTANLLDSTHAGNNPLDAALVALNELGRGFALETRPRNEIRRFAKNYHGQRAQAFRPTTGDYSQSTVMSTSPFAAHISADARPNSYIVRDVVHTSFPITISGDSGTILSTNLSSGLGDGVGICVGRHGQASLFEPFARMLPRFERILGRSLSIWSRR